MWLDETGSPTKVRKSGGLEEEQALLAILEAIPGMAIHSAAVPFVLRALQPLLSEGGWWVPLKPKTGVEIRIRACLILQLHMKKIDHLIECRLDGLRSEIRLRLKILVKRYISQFERGMRDRSR